VRAYQCLVRFVLHSVGILTLALTAALPSLAQTSPPVIVSTVGYINGTPLTTHTSAAFNTAGASALVAFVSTNTPWNGLPVNISSLSDNLGNTWNLLTGPTIFSGSTFTLVSAVYYVNNPITSTSQTITAQLTNPAPLVLHVFAVSGSDVTGPPIFSAITDPGAGATSANVTTAPITVPANSLLLSWVKNETSATATALDRFTLDTQSTSFLWAEFESPISAGSYTGDFQYSSAIGWQAAIVAFQPSLGPTALSQAVMTSEDTPVGITLTATSPQGLPLTYTVLSAPTQGTLSGSAPNLTYTPNTGYVGADSFTFRANDGTTNSNTATVSITVRGQAPFIVSTVGYLNSNPQTAHTTAAFNSTSASTLVAFVSSHPSWNGLPVSITGLTDNLGNTWTSLTGPTTWAGSSFTLVSEIYYVNSPSTGLAQTVTAQLTNPAPLVLHVFAVSNSEVTGPPIASAITDPGLGGTSANVTTAPISVPTNSLLLSWVKNETGATATAIDGFALDSQSTAFLWAESETPSSAGSYTGDFLYDSPIGWQTAIVGVEPQNPAPPMPVLTSSPANPTSQTSASFGFTDTEAGVTFLCQLDGSAFSACSSPASYSGLSQGNHTFSVKAQDTSGNQSPAATFSWTVSAAPTVSSVSPNNGPPAGGTAVTIIGANFVAGATVTFGTAAASNVVVVSATQITATTPAGSAGAVTVTVTDPGALSGSLTNGFTYVAAPTVSGISPNNGPVTGGTAVTITGTNFAAGATVTFGAAAASNVVFVSGTQITATTPANAAGAVTVTVTVSGQSGSLSKGFTYNPAVAIGFAQVAAATPQSATATVSVAYPAAQTAGDLNVVVVGWNDTTSTVQSVQDSGGNSYSLAIGPTTGTALRQSIYYLSNIAGGSNTVTVTFNQAAAYPDVRILEYRGVTTLDVTAGASGSGTSASSGAATTTAANELIFGANMVATSTAGAGTGFTRRIITSPDGDIAEDKVVTTAGSNSAPAILSSPGPWVMQMVTFSAVTGPVPTVSSVTPNSGPTTGGTAVTITGANFAAGAKVAFGSVAATNVVVLSGTQITATTPASSAGTTAVTVSNPGGQSGSLPGAFTYIASPTVSSVAPNNGPQAGRTAVTITGTNFVAGATVTFGGTVATNVVVVSGTQITATTPAGSAGAVTVTVANSTGLSGSLAGGFTYLAPPTVGSVSPNTGSTTGGTAVTITGTNFAAGATATFGGAAATNIAVVNSTTITATTPAGNAGTATVTVTVGGQSGSLTNGFTYAVLPTVTSVSPNNGPVAGETAVTITGTNFAAGATVTFGAVAASNVVVVSGTQITATTPANAAGAVTVTVTVSEQSGSLSKGFTYNPVVAIGFAQVAAATPQSATATVAVAYPAAQTAGDLNVVVVGWNDTTSTVQSVQDSGGNSYSLAIGPTTGTALRQSIYYLSNIVGGSSTVTVTFNQAAAYPDVRILEYRGVTTLDVTAGASGSGTSASSGAATTTAANELIFGANMVATSTAGAGTGFTRRIITSPDGDLAEDKAVTTAGSYSAPATLSSPGPWVMQMATFK
jgi:IPT/TIG domain/Bacterial Ig domain